MQTPSYKAQVEDLALGTIWSLWAELGVSGWTRRHAMTAIDIEPLLLATSYLGRLDTRLLQECVDWCTSNARFVSAVRLRKYLGEMPPPVVDSFASLSATVRTHVRVNWPGDGKGFDLSPTGRSTAPDLTRPALIQLRLRAIFGVSARAEVLRLMVLEPSRFMSIAELALRSGFGKDSVAEAADLLSRAGLLQQLGSASRYQYHLGQVSRLAGLLGDLPPNSEEWPLVFRVLLRLVIFAQSFEKYGQIERAATIASLMRDIQPATAQLGLVPSLRATGERLNADFEGWSLRVLRKWAAVDPVQPVSDGGAVYTIHRLDTGSWLATVDEPGQPQRPIQMPEWAGLYTEHPRSDMVISDDSIGAPRVAQALFEDAFGRVHVEIGSYWQADPTNQLISREFAEERLWPMYRGSSATFSGEFLRAWYTDRRTRLGPRLPGAPTEDSS
jgi:hypothetical protein